MKKQMTSLFEYEKHANARVLDAIAQLKEPDEKCLDIMSHILWVQMAWYSRMVGVAGPPIWQRKTLEQCREMYTVNNKILASFIEKQTKDTFDTAIEYRNTKGDKYSNTITEILTHLFNHSTYHRGQIVERLKGKMPTMPVTDYIDFVRMK